MNKRDKKVMFLIGIIDTKLSFLEEKYNVSDADMSKVLDVMVSISK